MKQKTAIIIGAGPGGLTAAYELLKRTDIRPVVYEMSNLVGGISKTVDYKGNRIDIGGHRFFSKSSTVVRWWLDVLPLQGISSRKGLTMDGDMSGLIDPEGPDPERTDRVMLIRERRSRILYDGKLFDYPLSASLGTVLQLGAPRTLRILASYLRARMFPIRQEESLEDFFINRFGRALYGTFFKAYTEKLWGVSCDRISSEWGVQRIKGLSISKAVLDACKRLIGASTPDAAGETSLIKHFMYPKLGPGQLWSQVAQLVQERGGAIHLGQKVVGLKRDGARIAEVLVRDEATGRMTPVQGDYFFSTMPVRELIAGLGDSVPGSIRDTAQGLAYRDFITVGLLLKRLVASRHAHQASANGLIPDSWLYIHEPSVRVGRIQVFNNWSPYMVRDESLVWIGLEYFCNEGDWLWSMDDRDLTDMAVGEMAGIQFVSRDDVLDSTVIRMPKAYPAYVGTYRDFSRVRDYTDGIENLFLLGRNGMHRYNNMDHSMLSAMAAVNCVVHGVGSKDSIWQVNAEEEYQETVRHKSGSAP